MVLPVSDLRPTFDANGNVILSMTVPREYRQAVMLVCEKAKETSNEIDIRERKSSRSLEQNRMLWAMLRKLSDAVNGFHTENDVTDLYCEMLVECGAKSDFLLALPETEDSLRAKFRAIRNRGKRFVNGQELTVYEVFIGSSRYTVKEMSALLECVLNRLGELGVYDEEVAAARGMI